MCNAKICKHFNYLTDLTDCFSFNRRFLSTIQFLQTFCTSRLRMSALSIQIATTAPDLIMPHCGPCSRPLRRREQPCKPEWYGNKRLYDYRQLRSAEQRLMLCKEARNGASLNTLLWRQLQTHLKAGGFVPVIGASGLY